MTGKKMSIAALAMVLAFLVLLGGITVYADPFFHFHGPRDGQSYSLYNERYQNDGISRHFGYDAIITGTSMTQNFKASEFDALFDARSVKVPFSGASFKEINAFLTRAVSRNPEIKFILRGLDADSLFVDKDFMRYDSYPDYLYDDNCFNDVYYLFNKEIFVNDTVSALEYDRSGQATVDFDTYSNWDDYYSFGAEAVFSTYQRPGASGTEITFSPEDEKLVRENIQQNVLTLVEQNPQIEFYLFITPYSIVCWDMWNQLGEVQRRIDAQRCAIEMMLPYENVHLFSFFDNFDMICDLNNYKDHGHYSEEINSKMLAWMKNGEYQLTWENYEQYLAAIREFYTQYPYETLFEK